MTYPDFVTLHNSHGLIARFSSYGARWISMVIPDKTGGFDDVLLGFKTLEEYQSATEHYYGAIVGRVCGRIGNAKFRLNGRSYNLTANENGTHHLHGGIHAFHNVFWESYCGVGLNGDQYVSFIHEFCDGEEGYPGNLWVEIRYVLTETDILKMVCTAICDQDTIVNLTNHAFFNLCGSKVSHNIFGHKLFLRSSELIECDESLIPTGRLLSLDNSLLDFRKEKLIGKALDSDLFQIKSNKGFSLAYSMNPPNKQSNGNVRLAAILSEEETGRRLEIYTNQPSMQVYTGYCLDGSDIGKGGFPYYAGAGVALEPQGFPDAVNHSNFPTIALLKNDVYLHVTEYRWSVF